MTIVEQCKLAFLAAPASLKTINKNTLQWLAVYFICGLIIFLLFVDLLLSNQHAIKSALLNYFFPQSWHAVSQILADFLIESQAKVVVANFILSSSLVLASIVLFPIKEKASACFTKNIDLIKQSPKEFPLAMQAWEEVKLLVIYITSQSIILWIGYYPYAFTHWLSIILSYLFLFFTFGLDFISPVLQRYKQAYSKIIKFLLRRFIATIAFGLLCSLPVLLLSYWLLSLDNLTILETGAILFVLNLIFLTLAIPLGTYIGAKFYPAIQQLLPPTRGKNIAFWLIISSLCMFSLFLHSQLIKSLHHKSQLLKAEYAVDWQSFDFTTPSLSQMISGQLIGGFSVDMQVKNPTQHPIVIENSQIVIKKAARKITEVNVAGFSIPANNQHRVTLKFDSVTQLPKLSELKLEDFDLQNMDFSNIFEEWRVDLYLEVWPGIPFIMRIY